MRQYLVLMLLWISIAINIAFIADYFTQKIEQKAATIEVQNK